MAKEKQQLKKSLNPMSVWAIAFGCIIGWGSFINPGKKFLPNSGVAGTAIAMLLGGLVMVIIAVSYAYMVPKHPKAGGEFTFTKSNFGKIPAFICGWFLVAAYLTNVPMNSTAIPLIMDGLFGTDAVAWGVGSYSVAGSTVYLGGIVVAVLFLVGFAVLNILGVEKAGFIQKALAITLAVCAFTLCVAGIVTGARDGVHFKDILWGFDKSLFKDSGTYQINKFLPAILATFAIAPWAFVGFDTIPQAAEEFKFPFKKVLKIMIIAIAFGAFVYISNNTICAVALTEDQIAQAAVNGDWVLLIAAENMLGVFGKVLVGFGVTAAVLSGMMGFYLASSRLMWSMAKEGYLPKTFAYLDEKHQTPRNALIFCLAVSLVGPFLGREALGWFVDMSAIGASIGFFFTSFCAAREMKRDADGSKFKFVCACLGVAFSVAFIILQLIPIPGLEGVHFCWQSYVMLGVWVALGAIFYFWQRKKMGVEVDLES
ncbi:MAG: APC family permease [Prevotellaceae bacterium]|nr:APC family permease [Candidatus Faecinaster equi]